MAQDKNKSNLCHFTFNAASSEATIHVTGVEKTWDYLKIEFDRHSDGLPSKGARYYQTLYAGPRLFAVDDHDQVYYHDQEEWKPYLSARDVRYSYDPDFNDDDNDETLDVDQNLVEFQSIPINAQWYFEDLEHYRNQTESWEPYPDIENQIIEEAFQSNLQEPKLVELDDYWIDIRRNIQIDKSDPAREQSIKRIEYLRDKRTYQARTRFSEPLNLTNNTKRTYGEVYEWCPFLKQWMETKIGKRSIFNTKFCLRKAIEGILIEGDRIQKRIQAKKLVQPLEMFCGRTAYEASRVCVQIFTRDSFIYHLINKVLRDNDLTKVDTLGPYCYLLRAYIRRVGTDYSGILYRGCSLPEEQIAQYYEAANTKDWKTWASFTSTSKDERVALAFQHNTRFIIHIEYIRMFLVRAFDIENLSIHHDEKEVLLPAGVLFQVLSVEKNQTENTWIIHIKL